jgi:hypothetical protein
MIRNSLEWEPLRDQLVAQIRALPYNPDLRRMIKNIDTMVDLLSKAEVLARSKHRPATQELQTVNQAIADLEKWIVTAALLQ